MIYISLKNELSKFLDGYEKLIILGIGNELKYDDGVGPYIISNLNNLQLNENILLINALTVPENFTGKIRMENPSHIIIIDACLMGLNSGDVRIVNEKDFVNIGISTHSMSLNYFVKYLNNNNILFLGIEPEKLELINPEAFPAINVDEFQFNGELTSNVKKGADFIIDVLGEIL